MDGGICLALMGHVREAAYASHTPLYFALDISSRLILTYYILQPPIF